MFLFGSETEGEEMSADQERVSTEGAGDDGAERPWLWRKGQSGNPAGRPKGARNKATLLLEELLSEGDAAMLVRQLIVRAHAGDRAALRFLLARLLPPARHRRVAFDLPAATGRPAADAAAALDALVRAVAAGEIAPAEAKPVADLVERGRRLAEAAREETAKAAAKTAPAAKRAAVPAPVPAVAPASVFSSVFAAPALAAPAGRRRDALLGGASPLPSAVLETARPQAGKESARKAA
jgi:uncharacterized protein DUF5681